jgi:CRISPR system Cascade subunit CasE
MYLSRMTLSRSPSMQALSSLLDPEHQGSALDAHHRLIWSAFNDEGGVRDFLWRRDADGRFYTLSKREPSPSAFFETIETRPFSPSLATGDRLSFALRANATRTIETPGDIAPNGKLRRRKHDVVMHALRSKQDRALSRAHIVQEEGSAWFGRQGPRCGFVSSALQIDAYTHITVPAGRGKRKGQPHFGVLDITGVIEITDPDLFLGAVTTGFGGAKSFGCGMMMIKRA